MHGVHAWGVHCTPARSTRCAGGLTQNPQGAIMSAACRSGGCGATTRSGAVASALRISRQSLHLRGGWLIYHPITNLRHLRAARRRPCHRSSIARCTAGQPPLLKDSRARARHVRPGSNLELALTPFEACGGSGGNWNPLPPPLTLACHSLTLSATILLASFDDTLL